jgi:hypothetical protein
MQNFKARVLKGFGYFFISIGVLIFLALVQIYKSGNTLTQYKEDAPPFYFFSLASFFIGLYLWRKGKGIFASKPIDLDKDKFVLYLRSFKEDDVTKSSLSNNWIYGPLCYANLTTEEEDLARTVRKYGDLVAVGNPNEKTIYLGAKRIYYKDNEWKQAVLKGIENSKLIILRAGATPNFIWELEQVLLLPNKKKVLIMLPNDEMQYLRLTVLFKKIAKFELPKQEWKLFGHNEIFAIAYFTTQNRINFYYPRFLYFKLFPVKYDPIGHSIKKVLKKNK